MQVARRTISGGNANDGFTLIELVLVLSIIAIALLAAAPALNGFVRARVPGNTAAQFVALTHYARSQAISDGITYRINIDIPNGKWWLTKDDGSGTNFVTVDSQYGQSFSLPQGVTMDCDVPIANNAQIIEFDPSGRADPATLHFRDAANTISTVTATDRLDPYHIVVGG